MKKNEKRSAGKSAYGLTVVLAGVLVLAGCAGLMAENKFRDEAAAKYVFNVPANKLLDETVVYLSGGAFGAALTSGASKSSFETDREKLTVAGPWNAEKPMRSRTSARVTKVDDGHSTLVMNNETQNYDSSKGGSWGSSTITRNPAFEMAMIRRMDPQAATAIEEGAKKAGADAKKK